MLLRAGSDCPVSFGDDTVVMLENKATPFLCFSLLSPLGSPKRPQFILIPLPHYFSKLLLIFPPFSLNVCTHKPLECEREPLVSEREP